MKYYAVTNDPTELMHYGVKGMKWGVIRTDAQLGHPRKPRSAAYKKAQSKLGKMMKSGIKKAEVKWAVYNSPAMKAERARHKAEKLFEKRLQQAREGRLRYKGITDSDVARITNRLILERNARSLSGAEKPSFARRLKTAAGEGVLRGTTSYIDERMKGRGRTTAEIKGKKRIAKYESDARVQRQRAKNEFNQNYYREQLENGGPITKTGTVMRKIAKNVEYSARRLAAENDNDSALEARLHAQQKAYNRSINRNFTTAGRAKIIKDQKAANLRAERERRQQEIRDKAYYNVLGKRDADKLYSGSKSLSSPKAIIKVKDTRVSKTGTVLDGLIINPHLKRTSAKRRYV